MSSRNYLSSQNILLGILLLTVFALRVPRVLAAEMPSPAAATAAATAKADPILATVAVGEHPGGVAVNSALHRVYVANFSDGTVSVLDGKAKNLLATVQIGGNPHGIAVNTANDKIYVGNFASKTVSIVSGRTNRAFTYLQAGGRVAGVAVNPTTNRIYVTSDDEEHNFLVFDGDTNRVIAAMNVGQNPKAVTVNPVTNLIYVAVGNQVSVLSGETNAVIATVPVGASTVALAVNPTLNHIYVTIAGRTSHALCVIDGKTNAIIATLNVGSIPNGVSVNPTTGQVYVANNNDNTVNVIDGNANIVTTTLALAKGSAPCAVAVDPATQQVYIASSAANTVSILDGNAFSKASERENTGKISAEPAAAMKTTPILATVKVGDSPGWIAVNSTTHLVYVSNFNSGSVDVLDGSTRTVIATVKVGEHPGCVAVNPTTNRIYVGDCIDHTVSVINGDTHERIATLKVNGDPDSMAVNPVTNRVYVITQNDGYLYVLDGTTNTSIATIKLQCDNPDGVAVNPVTDRIYVILYNQIDVLAGKTNAVINTVNMGRMAESRALAVNPVTNRIYVINSDKPGYSIPIIDGKTNTIIATLKVATTPLNVAVDPATNQLYTPNSDGTISIIDGNATALNTNVPMPVKSKPCAVAVDPLTHQVYVVNRKTDTVSIVDGNAFLTASERAYAGQPHAPASTTPASFEEHFAGGTLDLTRWNAVQTGYDARGIGVPLTKTGPGASMDIVGSESAGRRLRLRLAQLPLGKFCFHGICSRDAVIDFEHSHPTEIDADVDWRNVATGNAALAPGDNLMAGIEICIHGNTNPDDTGDFLQVLYQRNQLDATKAHLEVRARIWHEMASDGSPAPDGHRGGDYTFFDEGYNAAMRDFMRDNRPPAPGRTIGLQHLRIIVSDEKFAVWENDRLVCEQNFEKLVRLNAPLHWLSGYLYLVQSGLQNGPARDVYFANIRVHQLPT